jgi:FkbM family methyltransferase
VQTLSKKNKRRYAPYDIIGNRSSVSHKNLIKIYLFFHRFLRGRGLSRIKPIREMQFSIGNFLIGKKEDPFVNVNGLKIWLNKRSSLKERIGKYEPESTALLQKYLQPGDVFVDVGASIGWFSMMAAQIVGSRGKVLSIEPGSRSFSMLQKNIHENRFEDIVQAYQAVASDSNGQQTLYVIGDRMMWASVKDPREDNAKFIEENYSEHEDTTVREYVVDSLRIDDIVDHVDFIKIDVEGIVDPVFNGAMRVIRENQNMKLLIEWPSPPIAKMLSDMGYISRRVDDINFFFARNTVC